MHFTVLSFFQLPKLFFKCESSPETEKHVGQPVTVPDSDDEDEDEVPEEEYCWDKMPSGAPQHFRLVTFLCIA